MAEARLARACVLATLGEEEAAEAEAREGHRLWLGEPPARREALAPRVELLRSWAAARGREGLLEDLRRGNGGGPGGAGENGPPR